MKNRYDLTQGNILRQLLLVSLPVMGTSLVQMAYNLTDLFWLGRYSTEAVSSAGFGGYFTWLGVAVILLARIGTEVRIAQKTGSADRASAQEYAVTGVQLIVILGFLYGVLLYFFPHFWLSFFNIEEALVYQGAVDYLTIIAFGIIFYSLNPVLASTIIGTGNTLTPFLISASGLVINMILDPLFILTFNWGVKGAAIATVLAQFFVTLFFFLYFFTSSSALLYRVRYFKKMDGEKAKDILRLGLPSAIQSAFFTFIAMAVSRIIVRESGQLLAQVTAAQKIGSQLESLSWLISGGIATALGAFVGQNVGAKKYQRVFQGVRYGLLSMSVYGVLVTIFLFFGAHSLYHIFLPNDPAAVDIGTDYLKILSLSQTFMIIEAIIGGAFNGFGRTVPQSITSIVFNAARIPMALLLAQWLGINGIWWAISLSSIFKGIVLWLWFKISVPEKELIASELNPTIY